MAYKDREKSYLFRMTKTEQDILRDVAEKEGRTMCEILRRAINVYITKSNAALQPRT